MMKSSGQITRRYASALFELASESGKLAQIRDEVAGLNAALTAETVTFFASPRYKDEAKTEVLDLLQKQVKIDETLSRFLRVVLENKRIALVKQILSAFLSRADDQLGIARAEIISAAELDAQELNKFKELLTSALKKKVEITQKVDPTLKAGSIVKLGNTIVDASLRTRLANLKESLSVGV